MRRLFFAPLPGPACWATAALALVPLTALAQAAPPGIDAANPEVFAPPPVYRSVFADIPTGVEPANVPWRQANDTVGQFERGHMDVIKWEVANPGLSAPPQAAGDAAPAMSGHMHHGAPAR